ncbi:sugar kinase [Kribbella sp. NPDC003505]|uniref:sugar kinase n=1 Tax=Kribbella sp. NPDC003505 TaxID=3154448 RepID=UPI0033B26A6F
MPEPLPETTAICVGEAMIMLAGGPGPLADVEVFRRSVGGAECNVAGGLAGLGVPTGWISRVGDDGFGQHVLRDLQARGVDVGGVELDPVRPTALYVKESENGRSRMHYYRTGSAAAAMQPSFLDRPEVSGRLQQAKLVHTTGITAAISTSSADMLERLATEPREYLLSVDLNWRPALWRDRDPAPLWRLLKAADIVLIGADEAEVFAGTGDPDVLYEQLQTPVLVVKNDAHSAIAFEGGARTEVPALSVEVVETVGAGDAFAAGFLAGTLQGLSMVERLRLGHLNAAAVLTAPEDHAPPPAAAERERLLKASDEQWAATKV